MADRAAHGLTRMLGRDPHEPRRAATPLELFFDLTFVIAYGTAANELAHFLAEGYVFEGLVGFAFITFAVTWAWINFTWFASAFDTDDWVYRLLTMLQMVGVLTLTLGISDVFESVLHGDHVDSRVLVLGYVVMRVPMVFQWLRAARSDPERRRVCLQMIGSLLVAQTGWVAVLFADLSLAWFTVAALALILVEMAGPVLAEAQHGGTPWHAHHIAERYGLLLIITLGEGLLGTMASLRALVGPDGPGWSMDVAVLGLAGTAMTFGMWWIYFVVPSGQLLHARRERSFGWGYGHIPFYGAAVAVGAGLHVAAYYLEDHTELSLFGTVLAVAVPLGVYVVLLFLVYAQITRSVDPFHVLLLVLSVSCLAAGLVMAAAGASMVWCLVVLALSPWVTVVGYERFGHRHNEQVLTRLSEPGS